MKENKKNSKLQYVFFVFKKTKENLMQRCVIEWELIINPQTETNNDHHYEMISVFIGRINIPSQNNKETLRKYLSRPENTEIRNKIYRKGLGDIGINEVVQGSLINHLLKKNIRKVADLLTLSRADFIKLLRINKTRKSSTETLIKLLQSFEFEFKK